MALLTTSAQSVSMAASTSTTTEMAAGRLSGKPAVVPTFNILNSPARPAFKLVRACRWSKLADPQPIFVGFGH